MELARARFNNLGYRKVTAIEAEAKDANPSAANGELEMPIFLTRSEKLKKDSIIDR